MPFEIVRNDIVKMEVDAIVNTANPKAIIGSGVDYRIHSVAGPQLLEARRNIGDITVGSAAVTPGFDLPAKYVIHAVGPAWIDGEHNEEKLLEQCYYSALNRAYAKQCKSVAFPLMSSGNYGFPKAKAMKIAQRIIMEFLWNHDDMHIFLVVFQDEEFHLSEKMFKSVESYIDEHYVEEIIEDEYALFGHPKSESWFGADERRRIEKNQVSVHESRRKTVPEEDGFDEFKIDKYEDEEIQKVTENEGALRLENIVYQNWDFRQLDEGFSETLIHWIDKKGKTDPEIYKKANIDRKLFSKIRNNKDYQPKKITALALAFALELSLEETKDLIGRAGYTLTHSNKFDIIVEYFLMNRNYDLFVLNEVLFYYDQPLIGVSLRK